MCTTKSEIGAFGSFFFIGLVIGSTMLPRISDFLGRKPIVMIGTFLHIVCSIILLSTNNRTVAYASLFIMGFGMSGRCFVGYVWLTGFMTNDKL